MTPFAAPLSTGILVIIALSFVGAILTEKLKVSYTTIMILIGLALSLLRVAGGLGSIALDRSLILGVVVPPLIFEAAMRTRYRVFTTVRMTVLFLAVLGVVLSALLTGFALNLALGLPLLVAITFGVIISPTDPVSVVGILRKLRAPERLNTLLETEAYFNDATAVVLYPLALSLSFNPLQSASLFAYTFGGGILIGLAVSGMSELLYRQVTEPLAETYFTVAVMFGSYAFAESLGASGLVAVAIAGLYMGNRTMQVAMAEKTRRTMTTFWEVVTFMATSFAFLLLGLKVDIGLLLTYLPFILVAFVVILFARLIIVYPIVGLARLLGERMPKSWTAIIAAAGLRGAVSVALALSLPEDFPLKAAVVAMAFGIALLSLAGQGEALRVYLKRHRRNLVEPRRWESARTKGQRSALRFES